MEAVYKSPTELASAQKEWGLPYQDLPGAAQENITPEISLRQDIKLGQKQIQDRFALAWKEIDRSRRFIGNTKSARMLHQLHAEAKQEMQVFNQKAQAQMTQLQNIDKLVGVGSMNDAQAKKIKARMMYGPQAAEALYPEPGKGRSVEQQFGTLYLYGRRVENVLNQFRRPKERIPVWWKKEKKEGRRLGKVQIWDINAPGKKNENTGKIEHWRNASPEEIQTRNMYLNIQAEIKEKTKELYGRPDISERVTRPGASKGGGFNDGAVKAIAKPVTRQQQRQRPGIVPEPKSEQEYNALPSGARYKHPDGDIRTKK